MPALSQLSAAIPLLGALLVGVIGYLSGRLLETRRQLTLQKGQAYADYLKALAMSATDHKSTEAVPLAADAKTRMCIYGSPAVIAALGAFERAGARIVDEGSQRIVAQLLAAMRADMGLSRGRVDEADLSVVLFGPPGRVVSQGARTHHR